MTDKMREALTAPKVTTNLLDIKLDLVLGQLRTLAIEISHIKSIVETVRDAHKGYDNKLTASEAERDRLREALSRYGAHSNRCVAWVEPRCDCGYIDALGKKGEGHAED